MPEDSDSLQSLIAEVLEAEARGEVINRDAFVAMHPRHAAALREYFGNRISFRKATPLPLASDSAVDAKTLPCSDTLSEVTLGGSVRYFGDYEILEEIARGQGMTGTSTKHVRPISIALLL